MVSKVIDVNSGEKVIYKVIKDGYKTITEEIDIVADMPTKNTYNLVPSDEEYVPNFEYNVDTSLECAPIITFSEKPITPDGTEIDKMKYIFAPTGQDYLVLSDIKDDTFSRVGNVKVYQNGIVNNFSTNNYLLFSSIPFGTNDYEIIFGFEINETVTTNQCMFYSNVDCYFNITALYSNSKYYIHSNSGNSSTWNSSINGITPLQLNKKYLVKTVRISGIRHMYLSDDDGITWTEEGSVADENNYTRPYILGTAPGSNPLYGKIYLQNVSIIVNNNPIDLNWNKLPNNVNVVGPMVIDNSITKSIFSSSCYCDTYPKDFTRDSGTAKYWEWVFKIEKYIPSGAVQVIYSQGRSYESALHVSAANKPYVLLNNTANDSYFGSLYSETVLEEGKSYWLKLEFTGTEYKLLLSENGISWTLEASMTSSTKLTYGSSDNWHIGWNYHSSSSYHYPLKSELNLAESYIKVNGEFWWRGKDVYFRNYGTLNNAVYVQYGDLLTNFSGSNYLITPNVPSIPTSYEVVMRYKTNTYNDSRLIGNHASNIHSLQIELNDTNSVGVYHPSASYSWIGTDMQYAFELNKWYWIKCTWNMTDKKVIVYIKTDDTDWENIGEIQADSCGWDQSVEIGADQGTNALSASSFVDLKQSYIKFNDKYYWKPVEGPIGEYIPGILDDNELDEGTEKTYKLIDIQKNSRSLILSSDRNVNIEDVKFSEYMTEITIPEHDLSEYDPTTQMWVKSKLIEITVEDDNTIIYVETNS